jgi:hypothetical protein
MKKSLTVIGILIFCVSMATKGQLLVGVSGGYAFLGPIGKSNTNPHHDASFRSEGNSLLASVFVRERIPGKVFHIGGEVEYYQANLSAAQEIGGNGSGTSYKYNFTLNFLNVIVKPEFVFGKKWRFIINTGVYFSILVNGTATGSWITYGPSPVEKGTIDSTASSYFNQVGLGILGGVGLERTIGKRVVINLGANGLIGISHLARSSLFDGFFNLISGQLSLGVAYQFDIKKKDRKKKDPSPTHEKVPDDVYN